MHLTVCVFVSLCGGLYCLIVRDKKMSVLDRRLENRFASIKLNGLLALVDKKQNKKQKPECNNKKTKTCSYENVI